MPFLVNFSKSSDYFLFNYTHCINLTTLFPHELIKFIKTSQISHIRACQMEKVPASLACSLHQTVREQSVSVPSEAQNTLTLTELYFGNIDMTDVETGHWLRSLVLINHTATLKVTSRFTVQGDRNWWKSQSPVTRADLQAVGLKLCFWVQANAITFLLWHC